jgi:hypothetical protein
MINNQILFLNLTNVSYLIEIIKLLGITLFFTGIILLSGRSGKILDATQKIVTTIAAGTIAYSNITGGSNKNDDDKKDKKNETKSNDNDNKDSSNSNDDKEKN